MHPHCTSLTVGYHASTRRVHTPIGTCERRKKKRGGLEREADDTTTMRILPTDVA
jgi:hypothetical protein